MKKFTSIIAIVVALFVMTTSAFAATISVESQDNYELFVTPATIEQGETEFVAYIGVKDSTGATIDITSGADAYMNLYLFISNKAMDAGIYATKIESDVANFMEDSTYYGNEGYEGYFGAAMTLDKANLTLSEATPVLKVTFAIDEDAEVGTYQLTNDAEKTSEVEGWAQVDAADQAGNGASFAFSSHDLVTVTAPAQKTPASFSNKTPEFKTYTANNKTYKNVWTGAYTVTANDDNVTGVEVYIKDALAGQFDIELAGGTADFEIAVIGKPDLDTTGIDVKAVVAAQ